MIPRFNKSDLLRGSITLGALASTGWTGYVIGEDRGYATGTEEGKDITLTLVSVETMLPYVDCLPSEIDAGDWITCYDERVTYERTRDTINDMQSQSLNDLLSDTVATAAAASGETI